MPKRRGRPPAISPEFCARILAKTLVAVLARTDAPRGLTARGPGYLAGGTNWRGLEQWARDIRAWAKRPPGSGGR